MWHSGALKRILVLGLLCFALPLAAEVKWLDRVSVLVDDDVILYSEIERRLSAVKKQITASGQPLPDDDALKKQVLERLILESIQLQRAIRAGVRISDEELTASLGRIAEGNGLTVAQLREQLTIEGVKFPLFREDIRKEIMIGRVRQGT